MKIIKSILITALLASATLTQAAEKKVTIFTSEGYEKELVIDVPAQLMGQEDHYTKAYILNYMQWWNAGMGTVKRNALKYNFDTAHFRENNPPRQISPQAQAAANRHFSKNDFWEKVMVEASKFIDDVNYKADSVKTDKVDISISPRRNPEATLSIIIPEKYSRRANEYVGQYAVNYAKLWNSILYNGNPTELDTFYDSFRSSPSSLGIESKYRYDNIRIGGDIKNELNKLFESPEMRAKVIKDQMARAEKKAKE